MVGASLLERGSSGLTKMQESARRNLEYFVKGLSSIEGIDFPFKSSIPLNQIPLKISANIKCEELIKLGASEGLHIGTEISSRAKSLDKNGILISFNDIVTKEEIDNLLKFLTTKLGTKKTDDKPSINLTLPAPAQSKTHQPFPSVEIEELKSFYKNSVS